MFDIGWSELLLIAAAALVIVGPKELPVLLRTIGRYVGIIRNHANEFRAQFDDAIRQTEFQDVQDEMTEFRDDVTKTMREAGSSVDDRMNEAKRALSASSSDTQTHLKTPAPKKQTDGDDKTASAPAPNANDGT